MCCALIGLWRLPVLMRTLGKCLDGDGSNALLLGRMVAQSVDIGCGLSWLAVIVLLIVVLFTRVGFKNWELTVSCLRHYFSSWLELEVGGVCEYT